MTESSITWSWTAVEGAIGYAVQVSHDEMFDATDQIVPTAETSFTASPLPPATSVFVRVAAAAGSLEAPLLSDWSTHVTGMTPAPDAPMPPPAPSGLQMSGATDTSITWSWDAVMSADGYEVQFNTEESFDGVDAVATTETSHTQMGLSEGTTGYLRVRSTAGDLASSWTAHLTATTRTRPATPSNLTATAGEGSITWTWDAVDGADSYDIQYSADGAFTDGGESMEVMDTSYTKDGLGTGDTAYLRVRASSGTGDQAVLTSGWSDPLRGMSATPMVPAVPSNLTATGGDGSITWTWDMVEGATGYQVQVSSTEDFSGAETMDVDGTSHTAEVAAGTTAYLRVRATGMGDPSAWTTHVTGTSDAAPVPPPPAPDPVRVRFTIPDGELPMIPDDDDDEETAMAEVNKDMVVTVNTTAVITPMFVDGANGVNLAAGENMPFAHVNWAALQAKVVSSDGATFMIQRTTMGANQMMEPSGDVSYWTCGPFACQRGEDAPDLITSSAACNAWDPEVELRVGYIDNTVDRGTVTDGVAANQAAVDNDGVDVGWVYSSSQDMTVKHIFEGASNGKNYSASGPDAGDSSTHTALTMIAGANDAAKVTLARTYEPAIIYDRDDAGAVTADADRNASSACASMGTYGDLRSDVHRPDNCFRIVTADVDNNSKTPDPNWLAAYSLELGPKDADVDWGSKVEWEEDPFDGLTCESKTFNAMDSMEADVCELFNEEVENALDAGWGGSSGTSVTFQNRTAPLDATADAADQYLSRILIAAPSSASSTRFATLWFSDNDGSAMNTPDHDIYADDDTTTDGLQRAPLHVRLLDTDMDPVSDIGDFGKVDFNKDDPYNGGTAAAPGDDTTAVVAGEDGNAENDDYATDSALKACTDDDGGDGCDAEFTMDIEVTLAAGTALGCEAVKETVSITCTWDANGEMGRYRADDHTADDDDGTGFVGFTSTGGTGARVPGYIGAFASCKVN